MMRGQASENILTLMASIDRLHSQATNSELRQAPHPKKSGQTPTAVNEAAVADREVVHLNALFASPAHGQRQEQKSVSLRRRSANASINSSNDFDAKLARLIEDVVGKDTAGEQPAFDNKEASPSDPRNDGRVDGQGGARKTPYLEASRTEHTRDIRSEIDFLLAPYLEKTGPAPLSGSPAGQHAKNRPENKPNHSSAKIETLERQNLSQPAHKELNPMPEMRQNNTPSPVIGKETLNALLSQADLLELNDFIKQEIKNQISVWITQNIDKIIEDSLLSARSEARNAKDSARETVNRSG